MPHEAAEALLGIPGDHTTHDTVPHGAAKALLGSRMHGLICGLTPTHIRRRRDAGGAYDACGHNETEARDVKPLANLDLVSELQRELPKYLTAAAAAPLYDVGDMASFTSGILNFFKMHTSTIPAWARAARIVFAFLPNSAMSERVFALVKSMFGDDQLFSLSDCIQAVLMLRDNGRTVG